MGKLSLNNLISRKSGNSNIGLWYYRILALSQQIFWNGGLRVSGTRPSKIEDLGSKSEARKRDFWWFLKFEKEQKIRKFKNRIIVFHGLPCIKQERTPQPRARWKFTYVYSKSFKSSHVRFLAEVCKTSDCARGPNSGNATLKQLQNSACRRSTFQRIQDVEPGIVAWRRSIKYNHLSLLCFFAFFLLYI